ncbi:MAG: ORF6N domain-containing protein [Bacteroidetes bacterium]|nr:ORF6N domain-containing protein [Bacteroidota bacterium]
MNQLQIIKEENIASHIYFLRGHNVILDFDLASLYGVETRILKQAVKRNLKRFPDDFMFRLSENEIDFVVSQNVIPSKRYLGGAIPFAFKEQGVAMLSGVLNSDKAIQVNITIMRAFVQLRKLISTHKDLVEKLNQFEKKYDEQFAMVFEALRQIIQKESEPRKRIGYKDFDEK